jgi:N-acetylgalactosamine-6-sulfatase
MERGQDSMGEKIKKRERTAMKTLKNILPVLAPLALLPFRSPAAEKPNIIYILADDLGWGDLGCYGQLLCRTPRIDRMAGEGILFEQFYVNSPISSPSRASLLTGTFPARAGIHYWMYKGDHNSRHGMPEYLDPKIATLPRLLQQGGYRTAHFGKWHLGLSPEAPVLAYGYDVADIIWLGVGPNPGIGTSPKGTEALVDRTIRFVQECREKNQPFFVNLWPFDVHAALKPTPEMLARYKGLQSGEFHTAMQIYYACVTEMDAQIGRLLDYIDAQPGLAENTLIVFTSDNGPEDIYIAHAGYSAVGLPGPFRGRKRSLYEGGVRVPFIARWKGTIPAGIVDSNSVISAADMLPTCCRLAGVEPVECDGEDAGAALLGKSAHVRTKPLLWEWRFDGEGPCINRSPMLAIRDGDWKLLFNPDGSRSELYNIPQQPMELHSCAEKHKDIVDRLAAAALAWQKTLPSGPMSSRPGSDAYPAYPEGTGFRPPEAIKQMMKPVKVHVTETDMLND